MGGSQESLATLENAGLCHVPQFTYMRNGEDMARFSKELSVQQLPLLARGWWGGEELLRGPDVLRLKPLSLPAASSATESGPRSVSGCFPRPAYRHLLAGVGQSKQGARTAPGNGSGREETPVI
ncbi:hypothetical protein KIL84_021270 [Mauremys mutica]|uniref:Uncharacterized protein n=1 Tax=Mauremys mutica TaxID=74926 RepID=A0A9D4B176_9SAUR|nr:hypothetical protein KIL84_021270 [Mauremys mutica]